LSTALGQSCCPVFDGESDDEGQLSVLAFLVPLFGVEMGGHVALWVIEAEENRDITLMQITQRYRRLKQLK